MRFTPFITVIHNRCYYLAFVDHRNINFVFYNHTLFKGANRRIVLVISNTRNTGR